MKKRAQFERVVNHALHIAAVAITDVVESVLQGIVSHAMQHLSGVDHNHAKMLRYHSHPGKDSVTTPPEVVEAGARTDGWPNQQNDHHEENDSHG